MPRYELRIRLPDRPGAFGTTAVALGQAGVNITSFGIVEVVDEVAVDQLLVEADAVVGARIPALLASLPSVDVETFRPIPARPTFVGPLELVESVVGAPSGDVCQILVDGVPDALHVSWALVCRARAPQPLRVAGSVGAPSMVDATTPWLPLAGPVALPATGAWIPRRWGLDGQSAAVAAAPLGNDADDAVVVARTSGPAFRQGELRQLATVARVAGRLC